MTDNSRPAFKVVWNPKDYNESFHADSLDEAKAMCIELLVQWIVDETDDWKYTEQKGLEPTKRQVQSYDNMIDTCRAWVVQLTDPDAPDEQGRYTKAWEPGEDDLRRIDWVRWDELRKKF